MISTHAPRTGSDLGTKGGYQHSKSFQPTLPARGATINRSFLSVLQVDFNPRSPHGERRLSTIDKSPALAISTHAPRTGSDLRSENNVNIRVLFQPTLPARGATDRGIIIGFERIISTHAPRTGSDKWICNHHGCWLIISTHAPRTGSDVHLLLLVILSIYFNPRSPHGERHTLFGLWHTVRIISTHAPRTGSDGKT